MMVSAFTTSSIVAQTDTSNLNNEDITSNPNMEGTSATNATDPTNSNITGNGQISKRGQ